MWGPDAPLSAYSIVLRIYNHKQNTSRSFAANRNVNPFLSLTHSTSGPGRQPLFGNLMSDNLISGYRCMAFDARSLKFLPRYTKICPDATSHRETGERRQNIDLNPSFPVCSSLLLSHSLFAHTAYATVGSSRTKFGFSIGPIVFMEKRQRLFLCPTPPMSGGSFLL